MMIKTASGMRSASRSLTHRLTSCLAIPSLAPLLDDLPLLLDSYKDLFVKPPLSGQKDASTGDRHVWQGGRQVR